MRLGAVQQYLFARLPSFTTFSVRHPLDWGGRESREGAVLIHRPTWPARTHHLCSRTDAVKVPERTVPYPTLVWVFALLLPVPLPQYMTSEILLLAQYWHGLRHSLHHCPYATRRVSRKAESAGGGRRPCLPSWPLCTGPGGWGGVGAR